MSTAERVTYASTPWEGDSVHTAVRRVLRNTAALVTAYALPRVLTIGAVILAARLLEPERFGMYGAAGATAVILSIVSTAGMQPLLVRELTRAPHAAPALLRSAHLVKTLLNVLMLVLLAASATLLGLRNEALWATLLLGTGYAIGSYAENLAAYFQAAERMHIWTAANAVYGIVAGTAGALFIWLTRSLPWFCAAMVLGQLAAVGWLYISYRRDFTGPTLQQPTLTARRLLRAALPFAAAFLALTVYYKADVLVLTRLQVPATVGVYAAAYKLVDIAQALALAAIIAAYPRLVRASDRRRGAERWAASRLAELALLCMAPAAAVAFLLRDRLVLALFGDSYGAAAPPAAFLIIALVPLAFNLLGGYILAATDRMRTMFTLYAAAALLKVAAVALVAPRFGATGAALIMLTSEAALAMALAVVLHRTVSPAPGWRTVVAVIGVAGACAIAALVPPSGHGALRVTVLLILVSSLYRALDVVSARERAILRAAILQRNAATVVP